MSVEMCDWNMVSVGKRAWLLCSLLFLLSSCGRLSEQQKRTKAWFHNDVGTVRVLTTTAHVGELVRLVGGRSVVVLELIQGASDPHSYQLVKGDSEKFSMADVVFCSGLGLEHGPGIHQQLVLSEALSLGDEIAKNSPQAAIFFGRTPDPHMWMDISLWSQGCFVIARELSKLLPEQADEFQSRAEQVYDELMRLDERSRNLFQTLPKEKRYLVTTHDAFNYFTRRYLAQDDELMNDLWRMRCRAPEGLAPDSQISTQEIRALSEYIMEHRVPVLFAEVGIHDTSLRKLREVLAEKSYSVAILRDALYSDCLGERGTVEETYVGMMEHNIQMIYHSMADAKQ